jgi:hypothetical protein
MQGQAGLVDVGQLMRLRNPAIRQSGNRWQPLTLSDVPKLMKICMLSCDGRSRFHYRGLLKRHGSPVSRSVWLHLYFIFGRAGGILSPSKGFPSRIMSLNKINFFFPA